MAINGADLYNADGTVTHYRSVVQLTVNGPLFDAKLVQWNGTQLLDPDSGTVVVTPPVVVTPSGVVLTRFGSSPAPGSNAAGVVTKYGTKSFIRTFLGLPGAVPAKTAGASGAHVSWSMGFSMDTTRPKADVVAANTAMGNKVVNGDYDAAFRTSTQTLDPNYFVVECVHELDHKVNGGWITVALGVALKNHFYDVVKAVNPRLKVVNTLTAYAFSPNNVLYTAGTTDSRYGAIRANVIGGDADGAHSFPYPNYHPHPGNLQKWIQKYAANGYTDYSMPEWGTRNDQAADQPDLLELAKWITETGNFWKYGTTTGTAPIAGWKAPLYACWYDFYNAESTDPNRADDRLIQPAPVNALKALVAASPPLGTGTTVTMPILYGNLEGGYTLTDKGWDTRVAAQVNLVAGSGADLAFLVELHGEVGTGLPNGGAAYFLSQLKAVDVDWALAQGEGGNQCLYRPSRYVVAAPRNMIFASGNRYYNDFTIQHRATGLTRRAVLNHFIADDTDGTSRSTERAAQANELVSYVAANGTNFFLGDFNSATEAAGYPRAIFKAAGWLGLRDRGPVTNGTLSTFSTDPASSLWIEDIWTHSTDPVSASRLIVTNGASDHNGWLATTFTWTA